MIAGEARKDEIGSMARALGVFRANALALVKVSADASLLESDLNVARGRDDAERKVLADLQALVVSETGAGLTALAAGDLAHRIEADFPGDYVRLKDDFNAAMEKLEDAMGVIGANASAMHSGAGEISQAADDLSRRTEQQAATLEETAAALDQITATVKRTAEGAERAGTVVAGAKSAAEESGLVVGRAVAAMGEIERSSDQISQIIGVIDEIAFQTNLLALNAGVEAARAGDAGRGFAVVASEVRALAQRSAEAAKEIKALIAASSGQVKNGVGLVGETGQALTAIVERVAEINGLMAEITASAKEQATALTEVNTAVNQMDQTTQQNAAMVEQSTAASHNLSQEAEELATLVGKFHISQQGRGAGGSGRARPNPVRQAQSRIEEFARESSPTQAQAPAPAPARRASGGGGPALAQSNEPQWEQF
jgi:methyl-accepting chemotaxis protein